MLPVDVSYSVEILCHFHCENCNKWWTISDWNPEESPDKAVVHCPHCGGQGVLKGKANFARENSSE